MMTTDLPPIPDDAAARMERDLFARLGTTSRTRARRHRLVAGGLAVLLVGGGAGIAAVTIANQVMRTHSAYCYATADTNGRFTQVGSPTDPTDPNGRHKTGTTQSDPATAAIDNCAAVWRIGFFETTTPPKSDGAAYAVPDLVACMRPDQVPAVFPRKHNDTTSNAEFCRALGLAAPQNH